LGVFVHVLFFISETCRIFESGGLIVIMGYMRQHSYSFLLLAKGTQQFYIFLKKPGKYHTIPFLAALVIFVAWLS